MRIYSTVQLCSITSLWHSGQHLCRAIGRLQVRISRGVLAFFLKSAHYEVDYSGRKLSKLDCNTHWLRHVQNLRQKKHKTFRRLGKWTNNPKKTVLCNSDLKISEPKLMMKEPKNTDEVGKSLNSAPAIANSDLMQAKLWSERLKNKIQLVRIGNLKNTCFRPKYDHIRMKSCRIGICRQLAFEIGRKLAEKR